MLASLPPEIKTRPDPPILGESVEEQDEEVVPSVTDEQPHQLQEWNAAHTHSESTVNMIVNALKELGGKATASDIVGRITHLYGDVLQSKRKMLSMLIGILSSPKYSHHFFKEEPNNSLRAVTVWCLV